MQNHEYMTVSEIVEKVLQSTEPDLARELEPWQILLHARTWLCGGKESLHSNYPHMDQADVQSWQLMERLQEEMLHPKRKPVTGTELYHFLNDREGIAAPDEPDFDS